MIETEQQRRWWFATHPELSWSYGKERRRRHDNDDDEDSGRPSPEEVDTMVDERLQYETDKVRRTILELTKYYFGTEFQSKTPEEKEAILREDEDAEPVDNEPANAAGNDWWSQQPSDQPAADRGTYDKYEDALDRRDRLIAHELDLLRQAQERDKKGLEADPHTFLDLVPYRRLLTSPIQALKGLLRNTAEGAVVRAAKKEASEGPGKWVEVARSSTGMEHQSKMSGKPIIERGGKRYIEEYELNGVKFDDYKNGVLYEHKGPQGNLLNKNGMFDEWYTGAGRDVKQAKDQLEAAQGIPVVWRVGADQVKAFKKVLHGIDGITVEP